MSDRLSNSYVNLVLNRRSPNHDIELGHVSSKLGGHSSQQADEQFPTNRNPEVSSGCRLSQDSQSSPSSSLRNRIFQAGLPKRRGGEHPRFMTRNILICLAILAAMVAGLTLGIIFLVRHIKTIESDNYQEQLEPISTTKPYSTILKPTSISTSSYIPTSIPVPENPQSRIPAPWEMLESDYIITRDWSTSDSPTMRDFVFEITEGSISPDGTSKVSILVNGKFPGPLIEVNEGDTVKITLHNRLLQEGSNADDHTALHVHGLPYTEKNWHDGAQGVTQCSIPRNMNFEYEIPANVAGTFFYALSHGVQRIDGGFGPLVVHPRRGGLEQRTEAESKYEVDRVVMVHDWYHAGRQALTKEWAVELENGGNLVGVMPDTGLMNGRNL